ncbi:hypothetical protein RJT34_29865 [Clitoria ternatea]|uniref:Uncharacterized protein n=1 Tax=Clitoria ternatea TaxID=43366 RepID=A0AAN9I250_CLITE
MTHCLCSLIPLAFIPSPMVPCSGNTMMSVEIETTRLQTTPIFVLRNAMHYGYQSKETGLIQYYQVLDDVFSDMYPQCFNEDLLLLGHIPYLLDVGEGAEKNQRRICAVVTCNFEHTSYLLISIFDLQMLHPSILIPRPPHVSANSCTLVQVSTVKKFVFRLQDIYPSMDYVVPLFLSRNMLSPEFEMCHQDMFCHVMMDCYGKRLATASSNDKIKICGESNTASQHLSTLTAHQGPVWPVAGAHPKFGSSRIDQAHTIKKSGVRIITTDQDGVVSFVSSSHSSERLRSRVFAREIVY